MTPPWMGRLTQGFAADSPGAGLRQLSWARDLPDVAANPWAAAVLALLASAAALAGAEAPAAAEAAEVATGAFETLGSGVGVAWGRAFGALAAAASGDPHAPRAAVAALQAARGAECPGAMALACRVGVLAGLAEGRAPLLATAGALETAGAVSMESLVARLLAARKSNPGSTGADEGGGSGTAVDAGTGFDATKRVKPNGAVEGQTRVASGILSNGVPDRVAARSSSPEGLAALRVHCFGPFEAWFGERPVDLSAVKPRARSVLQLLAVGAGRPVHRDELLGALWPDDDLRSGTRNLQVAVSSLRQALDKDPASPSFIGRDGEAYLVVLRPGDEIDVATFTDAVREAGQAGRRADVEGAIAAQWRALGEYRGELLAGAGSGEWIVERRERFRLSAAEVAQTLAVSLVEAGDPAGAVVAAERGLTIDRYRDGLWRALIAALDANGDRAAAAKAALDYEAVLAELGVTS